MRTTVTLEADVAARLQELVHRTRRPFKAVLNDTLRQGLGSSEKRKAVKPFRVKARAGQLRPGFDNRRFNQLADELEAEAVAAKLARRR